MGLRRSIMGFDQEEVLRLTKVIKKEVSGKEKEFELKLDLNDLLILKQIADFPNRKKITKVIVDEKIFFWVSYKEIIKELPILGIGKQALSDRLDKMVKLGVLEREIKTMPPYANMTLFRIGDNYEQLKYKDEYQNDSIVENNGKVSYSDTIGYRSQTRDINNEYNNNEDDNNKEEIDKSISKKDAKTRKKYDEYFEQCWKEYGRKGNKAEAYKVWLKLSEEDRLKVLPHVKAYIQSRSDKSYQKDFERYLNKRVFDNVVYKGNMIIFDPERENSTDNEYRPQLDGFNLHWNEQAKCYISMYDIDMLFDGYNADNRPSSAMVMKNGVRYKWNTQTKKWEVQ